MLLRKAFKLVQRASWKFHLICTLFIAFKARERDLRLPDMFFLLKNSARYFFLTRSICSIFFLGFAQPPHQKSNGSSLNITSCIFNLLNGFLPSRSSFPSATLDFLWAGFHTRPKNCQLLHLVTDLSHMVNLKAKMF